ncbi:hypothetical protein [Novosphingobium sp. 9U]|uniref:hypothetical protein n=1 Tax=Novosphingobium sp. 9U TaxID=2653158 RepID=UPI00135AE231|nr:hypothetical protein [Novosphingobium sp. 9U]
MSGLLGICSFASLITYITSPDLQMEESGAVAPRGQLLLTAQFLCSAAQVFLMVPVAVWFYRWDVGRNGVARHWAMLGVVALGAVGVLRLIAMVDVAISDILFMLPMGLVGAWLIAINRANPMALPKWMRIWGAVAGVGLLGVGLNFIFNGGLAVFSEGPRAYGNNVRFHIGLGLFGFPGFALFATWSILLGLRLLTLSRRWLH